MVATLKTSVVQEPSSGTANLTLDASGGVTVGQNLTVAGTTTFTGGSTFTGNATAAAFIPSGSTVPTNGLYLPAANSAGIATNSTERLRIDSSGNVGINQTVPAYKLHVSNSSDGTVAGFRRVGATQNPGLALVANETGGTVGLDTLYSTSTPSMTFSQGGSERMRIDSSGNLLVGTTVSTFSNQSTSLQVKGVSSVSSTRNSSVIMSQGYSSSAGLPEYVGNWASSGYWGIGPDSGSNDSTVKIGIVSADASGAYWGGYANVKGGTYTNASDYRLKENVVNYADGALSKVLALRPINYNVIPIPHEDKDGPIPVVKTEVGFLAHELQQHIPELVYGEKDALNTDGTPNMQSVDYAKMTAVLVKAIQELTAKVTALEAKVGA